MKLKIVTGLGLASVLCYTLVWLFLFESAATPADPPLPVAVGLAPILSQALPPLGTVVKKVFTGTKPNPKQAANINQLKDQTSENMKKLKDYVQQEQLLGMIVSSSGKASINTAEMIQLVLGKSSLDKAQVNTLNNFWPEVTDALHTIATSKPDISILTDSNQKMIVDRIVKADGALKTKIDNALKKYEKEPEPTLLSILQENLKELNKDFEDLNTVTGIELKTLADGLAAVANQPEPSTPEKAKKAAKDAAAMLFKGIGDAVDKLNGLADKSKDAFTQSFSSKYQQK
jgi:hypothetical protein